MTPFEIAKKWLAAFNSHDLNALLALYHDEAEHFSPKLKVRKPETNGLIKGKAAMREWWKDAFERLPELAYEEIALTDNDTRVFMEYKRVVPGEEDMIVAEVLEIENDLII